MQEELARSYKLIQGFADEYVNGKYNQYKAVKESVKTSRSFLEERLASNTEIKKILSSSQDHSSLIKHILINYTILNMHHHAVLTEIESHKPTFNVATPENSMSRHADTKPFMDNTQTRGKA